MDTVSDTVLIQELASRHNELIIIRPKASNRKGSDEKLVVFCKTKSTPDGCYDLYEAMDLLHEAQVGLIRDCIVNDTEP